MFSKVGSDFKLLSCYLKNDDEVLNQESAILKN